MAAGVPPKSDERWKVTLGEAVTVARRGGGEAVVRARKGRALIAYLADKPERSALRGEIVAMLWSDRGRAQARASLRQCLFELRGEAPDLIGVEGERISLAGVEVATTSALAGPSALRDLDHADPAFDRWLAQRWPARVVTAPVPPVASAGGERWPLLAVALPLAALAAWLGVHAWTSDIDPRVIRIMPWTVAPADPASQAQAEAITTAIGAGLPTKRLAVRSGAARSPWPGDPGGTWVVSGEMLTDRRPVELIVRIRTDQGVLLWSQHMEVSPDAAARAGGRLADWTASVILCSASDPPGVRRNDTATALIMDVCSRVFSRNANDTDEVRMGVARRLATASPRDAYAHALLATSLALSSPLPGALDPARLKEAHDEAMRALALDPRTGQAYMALGWMALGRRDFAQAEALLRRGLAVDPDHPSLPNFIAIVLNEVGRTDEALLLAQRALARNPTAPLKVVETARRLAMTSRPRAALALIDQAESHRGLDPAFTAARYDILLGSGDPAAARAVLERARSQPGFFEPAEEARLLRLTYAAEHPRGPEAVVLARQVTEAAEVSPKTAASAIFTLCHLGRVDVATDLALRFQINPEAFFRPDLRPLLFSPRFPEIARRQGLWRYWEQTGQWPDVCRDPALPWRCGVTVKKASAPN